MTAVPTLSLLLRPQLVDSTWGRIKGFAAQDNAVWQAGDGTRGYQQITTEFIPIRAKQLLQVYHKARAAAVGMHSAVATRGQQFSSVHRCQLMLSQWLCSAAQ